MLQILSAVAVIILIMAWMNYVNLSNSQMRARFKEMAARKTSGANITDLLIQFICQSLVINLFAVLIALTIIQIIRQPFAHFFNIYVIDWQEYDWVTIIVFCLFFITGVFATAIFPAFATLRQTARQLLQKQLVNKKSWTAFFFTTAQYAAALILIAWIFVMHSQLEFILNSDLGMNKKNIIVIEAPLVGMEENGLQKLKEFSNEVGRINGSENHTLSMAVSGEKVGMIPLRNVGSDTEVGIETQGGIDENFIPLYGLKILAGRNFVKYENKKTVILSRNAIQRLGFKSPEEAVGAIVECDQDVLQWIPVEIIGVIEDYNIHPLLVRDGVVASFGGVGFTYLENVKPRLTPHRISARLEHNVEASMSDIENIYKDLFPGNIFSWYFLDDNINKQYGDQKIARNQIAFFTILAVGVACLGFLGMLANRVVEKLKEISVRRILGANLKHILSILLRATVVQFLIALVIGIPIAWRFANESIRTYSEQISLQWWHFVIPVTILVSIMLVTVSGVLWKAAKSNPVDALKYE